MEGSKFKDEQCNAVTCPICEFREFPVSFMLRGVCLESQVDKYFVLLDSDQLLGLLHTKMIFSQLNQRWEIVKRLDEREVLAYLEETDEYFPSGTHKWYFVDTACTDPGKEWRSLNLHLDVEKPGMFCCDDGACVDSELICNNFADCEDESDERNCQFLHFRKYGNVTEMPPIEFENNKKKLLALNTSFIILKIFDINDVEGTFDIQFMVHTQWVDKDLQFEYLKLDIDENSLSKKLYKQIWIPDIEFDDIDIDSSMSVYRKHIYVREDLYKSL